MFGNAEAAALARRQIGSFLNYGMDYLSSLPYHGYDRQSGVKYGIIGWGRATGWLLMGMSGIICDTGDKEVLAAFREIIDAVNPERAFYCIEPMPWMVPDGPDEYLQLMRDVDRKQFGVHMDFVNMISSPRRYLAAEQFIEECFRKLGPYIKSTHLKDSRMNHTKLTACLEECSPGEGGLDFERVLPILDRYLPADAPVLLEHMQTEEEYRRAYDYTAGKARAAGISV